MRKTLIITAILLSLCSQAWGWTAGWQKPPLGVQINRSHPLAQGLVGAWIMNEGSGSRISDLSMFGNYGSAINGNSWIGGGINLVDQEILIKGGEYGVLSFLGKDFTLVWSCKVTDLASDLSCIASQWGTSGAYREWSLVYYQDGDMTFFCDDGSTRFSDVGSKIIADTVETRALVFDKGSHLKPYKNGVPETIVPFAFNPTLTTPRRAFIGGWGNDGAAEAAPIYEFRGVIYYVYIYDRILKDAKIASLNAQPFQMFTRPLHTRQWMNYGVGVAAAEEDRRRQGSIVWID